MTEPGAVNAEPVDRRLRALEKGARRLERRAVDQAWLAALACASTVALGLPFLWDHTGRGGAGAQDAGIGGWHLLFYTLRDESHLSTFVRFAPVYVVAAVVASNLVFRNGGRRATIAVAGS